MSIVQEALKKAQNLQGPNLQGPGLAVRSNKKNFGPIVLLVVFLVLFGITIKQFSFSFNKNGAKTSPNLSQAIYKPMASIDAKAGESPVAEPYTTTAAKSKTVKGNFPDLILSGVMELVDGPRAIINNVIVATGDVIGGAKVKKIDKNKVVLQKEDSVVTLGME